MQKCLTNFVEFEFGVVQKFENRVDDLVKSCLASIQCLALFTISLQKLASIYIRERASQSLPKSSQRLEKSRT